MGAIDRRGLFVLALAPCLGAAGGGAGLYCAWPAVRSGTRLRVTARLRNRGSKPITVTGLQSLHLLAGASPHRLAALDGGYNSARPAQPSDDVIIEPGRSLALTFGGRFGLSGEDLTWLGDDGLQGRWRGLAVAPLWLRLRYQAPADRALWPGTAESSAVQWKISVHSRQ